VYPLPQIRHDEKYYVCDQELSYRKDVERAALAKESRVEGYIVTGDRLELVADFWPVSGKKPTR
jgi:hypothetical protein